MLFLLFTVWVMSLRVMRGSEQGAIDPQLAQPLTPWMESWRPCRTINQHSAVPNALRYHVALSKIVGVMVVPALSFQRLD